MPLTQYIYDVDMIWSDVDSQITPHHATSRICVLGGEKPGKAFMNQKQLPDSTTGFARVLPVGLGGRRVESTVVES